MIKTLLIFKIHFLKLNVFLVGKKADETIRYYEILQESRKWQTQGKNKSEINRSIKAKVKNQKRWNTKREVWRQYSETDFKIRKIRRDGTRGEKCGDSIQRQTSR